MIVLGENTFQGGFGLGPVVTAPGQTPMTAKPKLELLHGALRALRDGAETVGIYMRSTFILGSFKPHKLFHHWGDSHLRAGWACTLPWNQSSVQSAPLTQ